MSIGFDEGNCWVSKSAAPSSEAIVRARLNFVEAGATFHVSNGTFRIKRVPAWNSSLNP